MRTVRHTVVSAVALVALLLMLLATPAHADTASHAADEPGDAGPVGPSVVAIPYEGSVDVSPAGGWSFIDCTALTEQVPWVTSCAADGFTAAAPEYDDRAAPQRVSIAMRSPAGPTEIPYIIRLEPPTLPSGSDTTLDVPVPAGGRTLIPLTHFGLTCELCTPGTAQVQVAGVDPSEQIDASVTGAHLSLVPHENMRGDAQVNLRVIDDLGQVSKQFIVSLHIVAPERLDLRGLHRTVLPEEEIELDAADLVFHVGGKKSEIHSVGCSLPLHGTLHCTPDGHLTYTPTDAGALDQFAVRVVDTGGRETLGSVTVSAEQTNLVPATGANDAPIALDLLPAETVAEPPTGVTAGFTTLMDALGAR